MSDPRPLNTVLLTNAEIDTLHLALDMMSNFTQTGHPLMSNADLAERKDPKRPPRALSIEQMEKVVSYHKLAARLRAAWHLDSA